MGARLVVSVKGAAARRAGGVGGCRVLWRDPGGKNQSCSSLPTRLHRLNQLFALNFLFLQPSNKWRQNQILPEEETEALRTRVLPMVKFIQFWVLEGRQTPISPHIPDIGFKRNILSLTLENFNEYIPRSCPRTSNSVCAMGLGTCVFFNIPPLR